MHVNYKKLQHIYAAVFIINHRQRFTKNTIIYYNEVYMEIKNFNKFN